MYVYLHFWFKSDFDSDSTPVVFINDFPLQEKVAWLCGTSDKYIERRRKAKTALHLLFINLANII